MTWPSNLAAQVKQEFRDVARLRGAHEPSEAIRVPVGPRPEEETIVRRRRIVGRRSEA